MNVDHVEVLVEEPSMEAVLELLLPRILGSTTFAIHQHQCKTELLKRLPGRLRGYARWLHPTWRIVVVIDRDSQDCFGLKSQLEKMARDAGLLTRSSAGRKPYVVVNRLAIEELEAWYFGDWKAVRVAYPRVSRTIPSQAAFRVPDAVGGGTWEAFERILQRAGYFIGGLGKVEAGRAIAAQMTPDSNTSRSFQILRTALLEMSTP